MPGRVGESARPRGWSPFFATCPAGLARILRAQLAGLPGIELTGNGSDGEADYVLFDANRHGRAAAVRARVADAVFADAGRTRRDGITDAALLAGHCWQPPAVQRALSVWAEQVRPLGTAMTFSVVTRIRTGPQPLRASMRRALTQAILRDRPRWRTASKPQLDIWLAEWRDGELVTGLRLGGNGDGALAAAMVLLAGEPDGTMLDPCAGDGSVLAQALAAGWAAAGTDTDPDSVHAARSAAPRAHIQQGDVRAILEPDDSVTACVTRLPARPADWLSEALGEMSRVTRTGGAVILLAAEVPAAAIPSALRLRQQVPVRLSGGRETIWQFRRA